jgi:hypothetical protein
MPKTKPTKAGKSKVSEAAVVTHSAPPNWPVFKPPLPVIDLVLDTLVEDKVVVFRNFWPQKQCHDYVAFLKTLPLATTPGKPKRGEAVRVNDRFQINDPLFASRLWLETGLKEAIIDETVASSWYSFTSELHIAFLTRVFLGSGEEKWLA